MKKKKTTKAQLLGTKGHYEQSKRAVHEMRENIYHISDKELRFRQYKEFLILINQKQANSRMTKDLNRHFSRRYTAMENSTVVIILLIIFMICVFYHDEKVGKKIKVHECAGNNIAKLAFCMISYISRFTMKKLNTAHNPFSS